MTSLIHTLKYSTPSKITLKVHNTNQEIYLNDERWCKIEQLNPNTLILSYTLYLSDDKVSLQLKKIDAKKVQVTVEKYLHNPLYNTICDLFIDGKPVIRNLRNQIGKSFIINTDLDFRPSPRKVTSLIEDAIILDWW